MPWVTQATDDFNRANETPLGGSWTSPITGETSVNLSSNSVTPSAFGSDCSAFRNAETWNNDQFSSALLTLTGLNGSQQGIGLAVRVASGARTFYRFVIDHAATNAEIGRTLAGAHTVLDNWNAGAWSDGDRFTLRVSGPASAAFLEVLKNGVSIRTFTDNSSIASGAPGLSYSSTEPGPGTWDDWEGGELTTIAADDPPIGILSRGAGW